MEKDDAVMALHALLGVGFVVLDATVLYLPQARSDILLGSPSGREARVFGGEDLYLAAIGAADAR